MDRWETRWADTRIHGATKRQVAVMFAEEQPALGPLPLEPFRYYRYGERTVHLDGCVEVEAAYCESAGPARRVVKYRRGEVVFSQGDPGTDIRYLQKGAIKLSVLSKIGKEAVVAMLAPGDFFGEGALAGQTLRIGTATAVVASTVLIIDKAAMVRLLHEEPTFSDRFINYMLTRNMRVEADLVDQLFNSSEKRLARTLLLLARYGQANPQRTLPKISQETLAEMIGATRSRVTSS